MKHSALIKLLILISLFAHLLTFSNASPPTTRRLLRKSSEKLMGKEQFINTNQEFIEEGRMDLEKNDYGGVGANPEHDPKPPPSV